MRIEVPEFASGFPNLFEAINLTNRLLQGEGDFFGYVCAVTEFPFAEFFDTHLPVKGADIVRLLYQPIVVAIEKNTSWYACSKETESATAGIQVIRLNSRALKRPPEDLVATLMHECVHIVDTESGMTFGHGKNSSKVKKSTAPYRIERIARQLVPCLVQPKPVLALPVQHKVVFYEDM